MTLEGKQWAIVLAGGEGERMQPMIETWLGCHRPKQYCTFVGTRSMLQHTLDRVSQIVPPERILTVIGRGHGTFLSSAQASKIPGRIIEQPANRGTAPGILLPAAHIMAADPEATVLIFPSDHFIFPEDRFLEHVVCAGLAAHSIEDRLILLGAHAKCPETEYGWVEPGQVLKGWTWSSRATLRTIVTFHEKPSPDRATEFFRLDYLWNTMVMAVKVKTLWKWGSKFFPRLMFRFETLRHVLRATQSGRVDKQHERLALSHIYAGMPSQNFSRDFLEQIPEHMAILPMNDVEWNDWGRPDRVTESLAQIGKSPSFQPDCLTA